GERVAFNKLSKLGEQINAKADVYAVADLPIKANLFGGDLTKLTGGANPKVVVEWGTEDTPLDLADIKTATPIIRKENFTNLASLSNMTPAQMVQLLANVGDFLNQFRDSDLFDIKVPFSGADLGDVFDFGYGWTKVLNERLQGITAMDLTATKAISPVLADDVAFDLVLKRPGDAVSSKYTVTVKATETVGFKSINELAELINSKVAEVMNGALKLNNSLPVWVTEGQSNSSTQGSQQSAAGDAAKVTQLQQGGQADNAVLLLDVGTASGTLTLTNVGNGTTATVTLGANDGDANIASALRTKVATVFATDAANLKVSGSRADGFRIEFTGSLAGKAFMAKERVEGLITPVSGDAKSVLFKPGLREGVVTIPAAGGVAASFTLLANKDLAALQADIRTAMATATGKNASDITVSGDRSNGFRITFTSNAPTGLKAGMDVGGVNAMSVAFDAAPAATAAVSETLSHSVGVSEVKVLAFTGYERGTFELELYGKKTGPIRYLNNAVDAQALAIQQALEGIVGKGNVDVSFPQKDPLDPTGKKANYGSAPKFKITFKGSYAQQNIPDMTVYFGGLKSGSYVPAGAVRGVELIEFKPGVNKRGEVQTVAVNAKADQTATFTLSFTHDGKTYTTGTLNSNMGSGDIRSQLLAATAGTAKLGDIKGIELGVSLAERGAWKVSFGGSLAGMNLAELQVGNLSNAENPTVTLASVQEGRFRSEVQQVVLAASSGLMRVQLGDGALSATFSALATAKELQAILEAMPDIGTGNVVVTGEPQKWTISFQGRLSGRDVPELVFSPVQELALQAAASGVTSFSVKLAGSAAASKTITITGFDHEKVRVALQDALSSLEGVGAGNVSVAGQDGKWLITFTGELAGQVMAGVELTRTVDTTVEKVKAKAVAAAMIQVSAIEPQLKAGGITWGKLQFKPVNVDDFEYFAIRPSAGVSIDVVTPGTAQVAEVQRVRIVNAAVGAASQFELHFTDKTGKKVDINGLAVDITASALQDAINSEFSKAGIDGSVTVAVSVMNQPIGTRVPEGTRAFDITFAGNMAKGSQPAFTASYPTLRANPGAQMVAYTLQQGAAATASSVAKNEVQRLTISNAVGGTYGFSQRVGNEYYTLNEPFAYGSGADQQIADLKKAGLDDAAIAALVEGKSAAEALATRQAKLIELGLRKAFATGPKAIAGADVTVTAVAGLPDTFDIVYGGSLAGEDLPTLLLNSSQLKGAAQAAGSKGYA
ncbi:MAG: hypothetical protein KA757_13125, partial [Vogesella sp.]|nr:hypothetical protein [Vogesella sp.]